MSDKIAVLGAGPMGLAVAYQLHKNGKKPVIFEADDRVGGMTAMFDFNGLDIERYYHFHCTSDEGFLNILDELNIKDRLIWKKTKMGYWFDGKLQPWGNPIALLTFKGLSWIGKIRYGIFAFISTKRNNWKKLDTLKADLWVKKWVGMEAYNILWQKLFDYKFYHFTNNLSAAWIWSRIRRIGRSRYNLMNERLGHLEGGSGTLLNALESYLRNNGVEIHLGSAVTEVLIKNNKVFGVEVKDEFINFNKVVSTIPLPYVNKVIPNLPEDISKKFDKINNIAVVCVIAKLKKPISENFWVNINDPDMDIPGLVEYSNLRSMNNHIVYVPFYMPGEHKKFLDSDKVFIEKVKRYLMKINTNLLDEDFIDIRASRYRFAQPICEPYFLSKLPPVKLSIDGLWIADTSYYYPEDRGISESIDFGRMIANDVSNH